MLCYASCSVISHSAFFHDKDLQVLQNVCALTFVYRTKLFLLPHQLHHWHDYCSE